jgi:hypothetical protein
MKELRIKRLINLQNYENVEFEATFENDNDSKNAKVLELFIGNCFLKFAVILKRAGFTDPKISWSKDVNDVNS